jgi:hypothetical protein
MRVLLDHCVDYRFKNYLIGHDVQATKELGLERLANGKLLAAAEERGFQVFVTTDKNLRHQQNISKLNLAVITLASRFTGLEDIEPLAPAVLQLLDQAVGPGTDNVVDLT